MAWKLPENHVNRNLFRSSAKPVVDVSASADHPRNSSSKVKAVHLATMDSYLRGLHLITSCYQYLGPPQELVVVRGEE